MQLLTMKPRQSHEEAAGLRLVQPPTAPQPGTAIRMIQGLASTVQAYWNMRRSGAQQRDMRVIETLHLGAKKQLLLVSCKGERFLVGTGADDVQTIVRLRREGARTEVGETL